MRNMKISEIKDKIESNALSLATVDAQGKPHCIAATFAKVVDNKLVFTANYMTKTLKNIANQPYVAITVISRNWETDEWGYEIRGRAEYFSEGKWKDFVKNIEENKDEPTKGAVVVTVETVEKLA